MKRVYFLFAAAAIVLLFTSCDPSYDVEWVMVNHCGRDVKIYRYRWQYPSSSYSNCLNEPSLTTQMTELKDGDSLLIGCYGNLGSTNYEGSKRHVKDEYWLDSVRFVFSSGEERGFSALRGDTAWGPYCFGSDSYAYQEWSNEGLTFNGLILKTRLTYTLTAEEFGLAAQ